MSDIVDRYMSGEISDEEAPNELRRGIEWSRLGAYSFGMSEEEFDTAKTLGFEPVAAARRASFDAGMQELKAILPNLTLSVAKDGVTILNYAHEGMVERGEF